MARRSKIPIVVEFTVERSSTRLTDLIKSYNSEFLANVYKRCFDPFTRIHIIYTGNLIMACARVTHHLASSFVDLCLSIWIRACSCSLSLFLIGSCTFFGGSTTALIAPPYRCLKVLHDFISNLIYINNLRP